MEALKLKPQKRVACLYRVSTKGQVEENDIPMQKRSCRDFITNNGWDLVKEYYGKGVSGYKKNNKYQDILLQIQHDAENMLFDVLLVFMMDRLGRREDETPFVVEWFTKKGIEVWSVKEGQRKIENHIDKLMNYISFWQSSGESIKTSIRVGEKLKQMTEEGLFTGGQSPYGYKLIKSGIENKKGKELYKLSINPEEAKVVKKIFDLSYSEGYGGNRIARYLNEKNIPSKTGRKWGAAVINYILRNPIYKGYYTWGKTNSKSGNFLRQPKDEWIISTEKNDELVIVEDFVWDKVQTMRENRIPNKKENDNIVRTGSKSPLLFVGMCKCGHCGYAITTTYNYKTWTNKDGTEHRKIRAKYRCSGKALNKANCDGQSIYAQEKIESIVMNEIYGYLDKLQKIDLTKEIEKIQSKNVDENIFKLKQLQKTNEENYKELAVLNKEVPKSLMGKSNFKPELLNSLIEEKEKEIQDISNQISELENRTRDQKTKVKDFQEMQKTLLNWREVFENTTIEKKRMMLSVIIDNIIIFKDKIKVNIKLDVLRFLGMQNQRNGENNYAENTTIFLKTLYTMIA